MLDSADNNASTKENKKQWSKIRSKNYRERRSKLFEGLKQQILLQKQEITKLYIEIAQLKNVISEWKMIENKKRSMEIHDIYYKLMRDEEYNFELLPNSYINNPDSVTFPIFQHAYDNISWNGEIRVNLIKKWFEIIFQNIIISINYSHKNG